MKIPGEVSPIQVNQDQSYTLPNKSDPRKNDKNYACLIIKKMDFYCSKTNLEKHSNYLYRVFER